MNIRPIAATDAENFLLLCKQVEESGFMLYEPWERPTTVEEQRNFNSVKGREVGCF